MTHPPARRPPDAELLEFDDVQRRLRLGTRLPGARREVSLAEIVGSVNRSRDFDARFRPRNRNLRVLIRDLAQARPDVADQPISLLQVDHAYFVEDGHKRLAIAAAAGRAFIDANVDRFETRFHIDPTTTRHQIEATHAEARFRDVTGLAEAAPTERFPLSDLDCYLELAESVKAHSYDLSRDQEAVVAPAAAARHWLDVVFHPVVGLARSTDTARLLDSATDADLFLLFRRGISEPMDPGWQVPASAAQRGLENVRAAAPSGIGGRVRSAMGRGRRSAGILADEHPDEKPEVRLAEERPDERPDERLPGRPPGDASP